MAKEELEDEKWIHRVANISKQSHQETRVFILEFLDTDVFHVSIENCISFLNPLIESWDIDFESFAMEIVLNRKLSHDHLKKLEFREAQPVPVYEMELGLREFLNDGTLSADITADETSFLKSLRFNGKRPSSLYYYRELQNLRDPLNFLPLSPGKRTNTGTSPSVTQPQVLGKRVTKRSQSRMRKITSAG